MREDWKTLLVGAGGVGATFASALRCAGALIAVAGGVSGAGLAVIIVVGLGIVWQIPRHDDAMPASGESHAHSPTGRRGAEREGAPATATPAEAVAALREALNRETRW